LSVSLSSSPLHATLLPYPPLSTLFPYTTLFRSYQGKIAECDTEIEAVLDALAAERVALAQALPPVRHRKTPSEPAFDARPGLYRSEEHTSELQSLTNIVCRLLLEQKKQ